MARLPVGMTGVALVIYVHDRTGSILFEAVSISGPLLTGLPAATTGPGAALLAAAGLGLLGTVWFVAHLAPAPADDRRQRRLGYCRPIVQPGGWRAGVILAAVLPALGLPFLLARRGLLPSQTPAVVEADLRAHQPVVDEAGIR